MLLKCVTQWPPLFLACQLINQDYMHKLFPWTTYATGTQSPAVWFGLEFCWEFLRNNSCSLCFVKPNHRRRFLWTCRRHHLGLHCHLATNSRDTDLPWNWNCFLILCTIISFYYGFLYFHSIWLKWALVQPILQQHTHEFSWLPRINSNLHLAQDSFPIDILHLFSNGKYELTEKIYYLVCRTANK